MTDAVNEAWYVDSNCLLEARGFQWRTASHGRGRILRTISDQSAHAGFRHERNGGLIVTRRVQLANDTDLIRFAASVDDDGIPRTPAQQINSPWWLDKDRFVLLLMRAREAGVSLVEMARRQLAIPLDWSSCDTIVRARIKPGIELAAYAGPGLTAETAGDRRIIATEAKTLWMEQLYVPGLGRMPWLTKAPGNNAFVWIDYLKSYDATARGFS